MPADISQITSIGNCAIEVEHFSFSYSQNDGAAARNALQDISFRVEQGAFCVLVGSTGCGKTTLLRSLKPELAPVGSTSGSLKLFGKQLAQIDHPAMSPSESAQLIGYVMQDPDAQIVCDTVWHELAFGLENIGTSPNEIRRRIAEVAHYFGIEPWMHSKTEDLSGGQKQLVSLAAVLALRPQLLVLDEPTSQLDPNAVKQFLFILSRVNRELGITVVMATHSPEDAALYATQRVDLDDPGPIASFDQAAAAMQSRRLQRASLLQHAEIVLDISNLYYRFDRHAPWVLRGAFLQVQQATVLALVGGNGSGKTTMLRCLAGVLKPQRGKVRNALASSQALLPQDPKSLLVCDTVREELMEWADRCGYDQHQARRIGKRMGLADCAEQHPFDLSGGQQQKLAIAKLLLANPHLLFLDEPTKGLDPQSCAALSQTIKSLTDEGHTIVLVTHDLDFAFATADTVSMLFDGEIVCTEPVEGFFKHNLIYRTNAESRLFGNIVKQAQQQGESPKPNGEERARTEAHAS
ncbi:ABC transporter ATP-binding protein [uncultured Senegalimassilia sp.]|uniref:ABC transporter ATP-binding protein n=1 Tax=uncultured Senegalimassilia sp. TaxID=1714350 RepID=UPI0026DF6B81|nr:ABC transporter ATP-binding protein [uncultured Senegalimassilia sp.]